ncbi:hypothetical protein KQI84_05760 [bacterium]|nr:hypothetical protein [bacterium]
MAFAVIAEGIARILLKESYDLEFVGMLNTAFLACLGTACLVCALFEIRTRPYFLRLLGILPVLAACCFLAARPGPFEIAYFARTKRTVIIGLFSASVIAGALARWCREDHRWLRPLSLLAIWIIPAILLTSLPSSLFRAESVLKFPHALYETVCTPLFLLKTQLKTPAGLEESIITLVMLGALAASANGALFVKRKDIGGACLILWNALMGPWYLIVYFSLFSGC